MNKFNIIKVCTVCMIGIGMASCNDSFMDRFPIAEISPENSFKSAQDLELYTNGFYENLPKINDIVRGDNTSDNILYSNVPMEQRSAERDIPSEAGSSGWSWGALRKINIFFDNYTRCEDKVAALKYEGVARFFRAWFYFDKVKCFGGVPWYETEIKTDDEDLLYKPRDSREFIMNKTIEDLEIAVERLGTTRKPDQISKWTALAFLSRVCLYEGTYRKYHTELNLPDADKLLEKAYKAAERVMNESGYSLYTTGNSDVDYRDLFASDELKEAEVILGRRYSLVLNKMHNTNYYFLSKTQQDVGLTKDFVNTYLLANGTPFTAQTDYATMQFKDEMKNRDKRLAQTIRSVGYTRIDSDKPLLPDLEASMTGYQIAKFISKEAQDGDGASYQDVAIIRYAEVLLNYAEAKAELGVITQDDIDKSIRLIRVRAGMPNLNLATSNSNPDGILASEYTNVTGSNKGVILEIRRERRIELALEGFRYDDLMRWKMGKLLEPHFTGMYFPSLGEFDLDGDGTADLLLYDDKAPESKAKQKIKVGGVLQLTEGKRGYLVGFLNITKKFDETRDYLYPIPSGDIMLNKKLEQNPNWK